MPLSLFNTVLKVSVRAIKQGKVIQTGKEEIKLFMFADDISFINENQKTSRGDCWNSLQNKKYGKVVAYKINTPNSVAFVYTNNAMTEKDFPRSLTVTIPTKDVNTLE